jgi:para-nitrobenzyl esterase
MTKSRSPFQQTLKASLLPLLAILLGIPSARAANSLQVTTDKGKVEGSLTSDGKVIAFKGIPYAAPPIGDLRWRPPVPAAPWTGVRSAQEFGYHCVQSGSYSDMLFHDSGASEDCLTLNVWTPTGAKPGSLPVMVWIYGGGFKSGGTSERRQDGQFLARRDVVVVSMNYRLGIFGFFVHPGLTAESSHHASGNYGLLDEYAALQWVHENIRNFGGDPTNVTIFGESAGSFAVSSLMASPLSKQLIHKAIGESGGAFFSPGLTYQPREQREQIDSAWAQNALGSSNIAELRRIPTEDIIRAATTKTSMPTPDFGPDIDGYFLPQSVPAIYSAAQQAHIPLLAGWNADEARGQVLAEKLRPTATSFSDQAKKDFGTRASDFLTVYPATSDDISLDSAFDYATDHFIAFSTWRWLEAQVATGKAPVYRYLLSLGSPGDKYHSSNLGAFHSDDIEYVFGTLDSREGAVWRPEDRQLSEQIMSFWTNFARTGNPNGPDLPKWPMYGPTQWQIMDFSLKPHARPDQTRARYILLNEIWGQPT